MVDVQVKLRHGAMYDLRRSPEVRAHLESLGARVASVANARGKGKYVVSSRQGARKPQGRWRVTVGTGDFRAVRDNHRNQTLLRALDAAR